jgi:RNA polymerase sigma factor (sigma-70 family)
MRSTAELVEAVGRGESAAFEVLVRLYERAAWTTAWRIMRDYHAAQDVTQEAFLEAYRRMGQLRRPHLFGIWLLRIVHRLALRASRRNRPAAMLESSQPIAPVEQAEPRFAHRLLDAVASLPEHERLVVVLRYFGGHSIAEVAQLVGRPVGTVTKQLSRALDRLRSLTEEIKNEFIRN